MNKSQKKILVLGGTTFVSLKIAKSFISKGYIVDILTRGINPITYKGIRDHIKVDRKNLFAMQKSLKGKRYNYIIDVSAYVKEDAEVIRCMSAFVSVEKYIFISSGAVYEESETFLKETDNIGFNKNWGDYGLNKRKVENVLLQMYADNKFPVTIFRPSYIYGIDNNLYREAYFFECSINKKQIPIPRLGETRTQFIYIDDVILSIESILNKEEANGECFNLTNNEIVTWNKFVSTIEEVSGNKINRKYVSEELMKKNDLKDRDFFPFRDNIYLLDISKLFQFNVHVPSISLKEGLIKTYNWYIKDNPSFKNKKMEKIKDVITQINT